MVNFLRKVKQMNQFCALNNNDWMIFKMNTMEITMNHKWSETIGIIFFR